MKSTVTKRGQTVVPAELRRRYGIKPGDLLEWVDDGQMISVFRVPEDPIAALYGSARGEGLMEELMALRREERDREHGPLPS